MRGSQLVYDGLWRCLCPAFDRAALQRAVRSSSATLGGAVRRPAKPIRQPIPRARLIQSRCYGSSAAGANGPSREAIGADDGSTRRPSSRESTWEERLLGPTPPSEDTLGDAPVDDIVAALATMRDPHGWSFHGQDIDRHGRIIQLVGHLLRARGQPPKPFIYECLMDAMVDPQGSAKGVRKLLDDMTWQNIKPTATMCQSALAALANHPDYTLRQEVLAVMQEFWFTMDTTAKQSVVLGLLRDEQYELAYARLTEMIEQDVRVELWVYDIFIMVFGKLGFLDEMLLLLYRRKNVNATDDGMTNLLYYTLDVCSQAFHHSGTLFAWNAVVRNSLLQPSDGIVENVLATAARYGDTALATEALERISQRTRVLAYHYEAVAEAFARSGDMAGALRILGIMKQNGIRIVRGTTRAMHEALKRSPRLVREAETALRSLEADGQLPLAVVSVVMEAIAEMHGSEQAMDLYRDVPSLCGEQASASMVQTLIMHSRDGETRRSLARDYAANIAQDDDAARNPQVYNSLISACAEAGEMDLAFRFARQAMALGKTKRELAWVKQLVECAIACEDGRIWEVVDRLDDDDSTAMVQRMLQQTRLAKRAASLKSAP
ncbi:Uncharacterized protein TPAR_05911 [Tolypocladium paradoxum]|uniref:Pentatricopeptide repeat-containing protein-mitochondrial domain-containing protein n=1 Tax=Tolypocladium paradoxum TaxID=94208 RepID=A0A2S4KUP0_9HYPO|nr:Uncharacterized protein TPAR_05911 [Tolypocladium paradoxum]